MKIELHHDSFCSDCTILLQNFEQRNECLTLSWAAKNLTNFRFMNKIFTLPTDKHLTHFLPSCYLESIIKHNKLLQGMPFDLIMLSSQLP